MIFVLMAAHDTSTITLSNMVYQLAKHPQWQQRLRDESLALNTPTPDFEQLASLTAMGMVMKEALRLCAPAPGLPRRAARSEEHTSELQSLMRISYAVFCLKKKTHKQRPER